MLVLGLLLSAPPLDAAGHMALDEAVLLESPQDALVLRIYRWSGPGCTFGYSQPISAAREACRSRGWRDVDPVRRATGGGIVFHDGDVTFSVVFPWDRTLAPDSVYKNVHRGVHSALKALGARTALWSPRQRPLGVAAACFSRAEPMDLVADGERKVLGGALRKKGRKGLYQGSLRPEALGLPREALERAVGDGVARELGAPRTALDPRWLESARGLETRYRSSEWNDRR